MSEICKGKSRDRRFPYPASQCGFKAWKDGYCKHHHPDEIKRKREERWRKKDEMYKNSKKP